MSARARAAPSRAHCGAALPRARAARSHPTRPHARWIANEWIDPLAAANLGWHPYMWLATAATAVAIADSTNSVGDAAMKFADALEKDEGAFDLVLYQIDVDLPTLQAANATIKKALGEAVDGDNAPRQPLKRSRTL